MTNDKAANRFIAQLQDAGDKSGKATAGEDPPEQIVINRPVRCTFYFGAYSQTKVRPTRAAGDREEK